LKRDVSFLASDTLEGRAAGTQGGRAAAAFLAMEFKKAGLQPGVDGGDFLQQFAGGYQNLLAVAPGSDPDLQDEVIIVSGHFDHVGFGNRSNSFGPYGQIHNGADDNASGTSAILEVARALGSLDTPLRRTVLLALWDAEEGGMIGSKHWLKHPTVPLENVRLMINCDMVGRLRNDVLVAYGTRTAAGLRQHLAEANRDNALKFNFDWRQRSDSDHWPFFQRGIPYLLLHTGDHDDYHRPSDDADKINFEGLETISRLLFDLTRQIADADTSLTFREASRNERPWHKKQAEVLPPTPPTRLGLSWNRERRPGEPFDVTWIEDGSPAAEAGLQVGDRITALAGRSSGEIDSLVDVVLAAPHETTIAIERPRETAREVRAITLRGNPIRLGVTWKTNDAEPGAAIITSVVPGSPAARAGVEPLDRLLPAAGIAPADDDWLHDIVYQDEITFRRDRRGRIDVITLSPLEAIDPQT